MKECVWQFVTAARSVAAAAALPLCPRGWSLKCTFIVLGSLLWSGFGPPRTGLLGATGMVPRSISGQDHLILVPSQGGTGNLLQESVVVKAGQPPALGSSYDPGLPSDVLAFLRRQNVSNTHGAGVQVDLSNDKTVDGKVYREAGGLCPVFGKYIETYQPNRDPYPNNFLADVPSEEQYKRSGPPLPGGFGMTMVSGSNERFSPITHSRLASAPSISKKKSFCVPRGSVTAKTAVGKCAQYAFQTKALSPTTSKATEFRYPFVYDTQKELCYLLYISMQRMKGKKYCSTHGDSSLTWYCFEPMKNPKKNTHLVYGSAYVGVNPDAYQDKCPTEALAGQRFGVWNGKSCVDYANTQDAIVQEIAQKEDCWALAFTNDKAASDQPIGNESFADNPWTNWIPYVNSNWPKSHGRGYNYAVFYIDKGKKKCVVSHYEPTCLITDAFAVSYTGLSSLEEVTVDYLSPKEEVSECDPSTRTRVRKRVQGNRVLEEETEPCTPEENNTVLMVGLASAGVLLLAGIMGGFFYLRKKKVPPPPAGAEDRAIAFEDQEKRRRTKQGDLMQEAEPSFWNEAEDENAAAPGQTTVMVEETY